MPANRPTRAKVLKADKPEKSSSLPPELSDRLNRLATLPQNWNSYGAAPINPEAKQRARGIIRRVLALAGKDIVLPFVAPSPDGGIELEWITSSGKELMLEIPPNGEPIAFLLVEPTGTGGEHETEGTIGDLYTLKEVVRRLLLR